MAFAISNPASQIRRDASNSAGVFGKIAPIPVSM